MNQMLPSNFNVVSALFKTPRNAKYCPFFQGFVPIASAEASPEQTKALAGAYHCPPTAIARLGSMIFFCNRNTDRPPRKNVLSPGNHVN